MHPLAPDTITKAAALDLLRRATEAKRNDYVLLYTEDRFYLPFTREDAEHYHPNAAIIAQSYCAGCGDILCVEYETHCQACKEYDAPAAVGEHPPIAADVAEWVELEKRAA